MTNESRRVVLVDDSRRAATSLEAWRNLHPQDAISLLAIPPQGRIRPAYGSNGEKQRVHVADVEWLESKRRSTYMPRECREAIFDTEIKQAITDADVIISFLAMVPRAVFKMHAYFEHFGCSEHWGKGVWVEYPGSSLTPEDLQGLRQISFVDPELGSLFSQGHAQMFFERNFDINARNFAPVWRGYGLPGKEPGSVEYHAPKVPTPLTLQIFLHLARSSKNEWSRDELHEIMEDWKGTGKYQAKPLGSHRNNGSSIDYMVYSDMLERLPNGNLIISEQGHAYAASLHPDLYDPDLPFRIDEWASSWPASRPKIDRYLKTFFGKQSRYRAAV